jgi:hypothetical protein
VFKELEPGLHISRLAEADFLNFVRLAAWCTRYVRLREVRRSAAGTDTSALVPRHRCLGAGALALACWACRQRAFSGSLLQLCCISIC